MKHSKKAKFLAYCIRGCVTLLLKTCKFEVTGLDRLEKEFKEGPVVLGIWHNRIAALAGILPALTNRLHFTAFVSQSRDGELLSQLILSYPSASVIRVPHDNRAQALLTTINTVKKRETIVMFTPDGPRGPVYQPKRGIENLLTETNASLIPFSWESSKYWELKTWDRFRIPKPFTTIKATFGSPIKNPTLDQIADALNKP